MSVWAIYWIIFPWTWAAAPSSGTLLRKSEKSQVLPECTHCKSLLLRSLFDMTQTSLIV